MARLEGAGRTVIFAAVDGRIEGLIGIADEIKQNAPRAVDALHRLGLRVIMMTGDNERAAASVAARGRRARVPRARPAGGQARAGAPLQSEGLSVAMVGDGVNDAPALAQADIGIAMSTGTDVAIEAGDITLLHGDISKVAEAIALSRGTLTTIKQNLLWAFGYNVVAIPIAALGLLNPIIAGGAMAFSSVSVMTNSLRLRSKAKRVRRDERQLLRRAHRRLVLGDERRPRGGDGARRRRPRRAARHLHRHRPRLVLSRLQPDRYYSTILLPVTRAAASQSRRAAACSQCCRWRCRR